MQQHLRSTVAILQHTQLIWIKCILCNRFWYVGVILGFWKLPFLSSPGPIFLEVRHNQRRKHGSKWFCGYISILAAFASWALLKSSSASECRSVGIRFYSVLPTSWKLHKSLVIRSFLPGETKNKCGSADMTNISTLFQTLFFLFVCFIPVPHFSVSHSFSPFKGAGNNIFDGERSRDIKRHVLKTCLECIAEAVKYLDGKILNYFQNQFSNLINIKSAREKTFFQNSLKSL